MNKTSSNSKKDSYDNLKKEIEALASVIEAFDKKIDRVDSRLDAVLEAIEADQIKRVPVMASRPRSRTERYIRDRARTEQLTERTEQFEQRIDTSMSSDTLNRITGRHREILAMLINSGFHTYAQIADKLNISQSRARAYIAELKNKHNVPLRHVRDPEGYKVGIDVRFVEEIILQG